MIEKLAVPWRPSVDSTSLSQLLHYLLKHLSWVVHAALRGAVALERSLREFYCKSAYDHAAGHVIDIGCGQFLNFRFAVHDSAPWLRSNIVRLPHHKLVRCYLRN